MTSYSVYVLPRALDEIERLPGHIRSRVRRAILDLQHDAQPAQSKHLTYELGSSRELYRLRLEAWRVVYLVDREAAQIYVLAARRRPPYAYNDLDTLAKQAE
jgi:mRNA-degrading endonuclease RelE of RelBE toxin-antitoxin system